MYGTIAIAVSKALRYPQLGAWLAEIDLTRSANLRVEQTGRRRLRHYTVWAEPDDLFGCVARVISIAESPE